MAKGAGRPCSLSFAAAPGAREEVVVREAISRSSGFRGFWFVAGRRRRARRIRCSRSSATLLLTSARRTRRRCWLEVCTGAGREVGVVVGRGHSLRAPRLAATVQCVSSGVRSVAAERDIVLAGCLRCGVCVREAEPFLKGEEWEAL